MIDKDDSLKNTILKQNYFPVNESVLVHFMFVKNFDFNNRYLYVDDDLENGMMLNLRDQDVIEKLNSARVKGIPGCCQIDVVYLQQAREVIDG